MTDLGRLVLLAHLGATLFMTGLIWYVQVVHYPLFEMADRARFAAWEARHSALTTWVVAPVMLLEVGTGLWLAASPPRGTAAGGWWLGVLLLAVIWLATAFLSVPIHGRLAGGWDATAHGALVATNWLRTVAWSLRAALVLGMAGRLIR